jgi:hypothetical protein
MTQNIDNKSPREYDFALIVGSVGEVTSSIEDALFEAGCDDATLSVKYGLLYMEFSRTAESLERAIITAILDVRRANLGADVLRVDECNLVTMAEIARRIGRSRQLVFQYMSGQRGPGGFPPPSCHLSAGAPLWAWCAVSYWLAQNDILRPEDGWNAEVVAAINNVLELAAQKKRNAALVKQVATELDPLP